MSDNEDTPTRTRKPLGLKRSVDAGEVKQTFSHGRTNKVAVEVKRRRKLLKPGEAAPAPEPVAAPAPAPAPVAKKPAAKKPAAAKKAPAKKAAAKKTATKKAPAKKAAAKKKED